MLSEAIRRRLEQLNRAPIEPGGADRASAAVNAPHSPPLAVPSTDAHAAPLAIEHSSSPPAALSTPSEESNSAGTHLRLRRPLAAICPRLDPVRGALWPAGRAVVGRPAAHGAALHPELAALAEHGPHRALYLDLETCGFAGSMIFLVGLIWHDGNEWWLDQLLARNYAEERAVLATLWQIAAPQRVLVTFNGKSFDWPMVKDRSTLHRLVRPGQSGHQAASAGTADDRPLLAAEAAAKGQRTKPPRRRNNELQHSDLLHRAAAQCDLLQCDLLHCDLLHHARRRWRDYLPDCRLQTLERIVCRRHRRGDVSGAAVPAAYHDYVRRGELRIIEPVLHHNALDLVTLVQIGHALVRPLERMAESA